jgi:hypothetical protein
VDVAPPLLVKVVDLSAVVPGRGLPLRVAPAPGEAIDSWLEVTARRMDLPLGAVARALNLPTATQPVWIRWLSRDQLEAIEAATGVSSGIVEAMTLSVYNGTALQLDPDSHRLDRYALALAIGSGLGADVLALHECDNPRVRQSGWAWGAV